MALKVASRGTIPPFIVMDVMRAANEREAAQGDVIHMEVGQPSTPAPAGVKAAAHRALDADKLGYTDAFGIPPLRQAVARHIRDWYGVEVPVERIAITTGSSGGFILSFLAAFDPGDRVALVEPGYPCYRNILSALGIEAVPLQGTAETRFQPTPALLDRVAGPLDGLIVASPSNPTGTMLDHGAMKALVDYCADRGIRVISDEIYHGISYGIEPVTAAALDPRAVVINSFSKYFSMTGWRKTCSSRRRRFRSTRRLACSDATTNCGPTSNVMRPTASCCWRNCRRLVLTGWRRPTARSTCTPI